MLKKRLDISEKLFSFPKQMEKYLPGFEQDGYKLEKVSLDKLAKDNNLYDDKDLNYHTRIWGTNASNYKFDDSAVDKWLGSDMIYGVKHKDGSIELGNGRHRCRALLNSGYNEIEMPILVESFETDKFMPDTAGYVLPDGKFAILDVYHGEDSEYKGKGYPEFSATHPEEDTCIRLYSEPNEIQYKKLEDIIDYYLESSGYCKVEVWKGNRYLFYKVYSLYPDACQDYAWDEELGNWTGEKLIRIIKNYFRNNLNESLSRDQMIAELRRWGKNYKFEKYNNKQIYMIYMRTLNEINRQREAEKEIVDHSKYCPECGIKLNPLGECPVCDLGEEDMLDESVDKASQPWAKVLFKVLKKHFKSSLKPLIRSFLLPDGTFISTPEDENNTSKYLAHYTIDNWIGSFVYDYFGKTRLNSDTEEEKAKKLKDYGITDEDMQLLLNNIDFHSIGSMLGCPTLEDLGAIRLNGTNEYYIVIPDKHKASLTSIQYIQLEEWLYAFGQVKPTINVQVAESDWADCDYDTSDIDYIISRIRRYYAFGRLDEDTIKVKDGKWVNKGKEGTHGTFKTKKAADAQRKAMFANGWHESLDEDISDDELTFTNSGKNRISCYYNDDLIGWVYVSDTGYIYYLEVKKDFRNNKIGARLVQKALERGGYWFHVESPNIKAIRFYNRWGFVEQPDTKSDYLKLFVLQDKLPQFRQLEASCNGDLKKMLGDMPWVYDEIIDYNEHENARTKFDAEGNQIEESTDENLNEKIEKHETLNPKIWNEDKTLKDEVKEKILEIVDKFKHQLEEKGVKLDIADIYLLGSNANYNYTNDSDLDIHIMANEESDCLDKHLPIIYDAYKKIFNDKYDITINGIDVELYVENINDSSNVATGVYSLNKGWIKEPTELTVPEIDEDEVEKRVDEWENKYYAILDNPSIEAIDNYLDELNLMRAKALKEEGEFAIDNLVFKELRNLNYIKDLKELKVELESKELSL